ncbi:MAG: efflux RND transporter permease subunit [Spirochaetes bacterium]|nr:efflux RND transporter permease subunit [Spirochaetota bacterium]
MKKVISFLIDQKLFIGLMVFLAIILGYMSLTSRNREAFPEVSFDMVTVTTIYPGGSPDEIETLITIPIEKKIREVDGIDKVRSYNIENVSVLAVYLDEEYANIDDVVQNLKDAVDSVSDLPSSAEVPVVKEIKIDKTQVINFAIYAKNEDIPYSKLRETAKKLEDFLYDFDGVAEVTKDGYLDKEFLIEVNPGLLEFYRFAINDVVNTLRNRNRDIPGGPLRIGDDEYVLRMKGQYTGADEIKKQIIRANDGGFETTIADLAQVSDTFEEPQIIERINGHNAIVFQVLKKRSMDEITLATNIKDNIENFSNPYPDEISVVPFDDMSEFTEKTINTVLNSATTGFILCALVLLIFLGPRMASIVTSTIPMVFLVAFIFMSILDVNLNVISLFGMIMVLGMIVDFGIVVTENCHRYIEMGQRKGEAIVNGVYEIFKPVTISFICISASFVPLLLLTGLMGKFIKNIPLMILICLSASWVVALFLMPTFLKIFSKEKKGVSKSLETEDGEHLEKGFMGRIQLKYISFIKVALRFRYITVAILVALLIGSLMLIPVAGFVFVPGGGAESMTIKTYLPISRNLKASLHEVQKIESLILELPETELETTYSRVGIEETSGLDPRPGDGTNKSTIKIDLTPVGDRKRTAYEIEDELRKKIDKAQKSAIISEDLVYSIEINESGPPVGKPINIEIRGEDFTVIEKIVEEYKTALAGYEGVYDITTDLEEGKEEIRYTIDDAMAARTNVNVAQLGSALNASYAGAVATNVKLGDEAIDVRVRFDETFRRTRESLDSVMISNGKSGIIPLDQVTQMTIEPGYSQINRLNYKRLVQVQAYVDLEETTAIRVNGELAKQFADISQRYPGYEVSYGGEQEDTAKSMSELGSLFIISILIIYIVLAAFFQSLLTPIVVMSAIPFAMVGIMFAVLTHGQPLSFNGMIAFFSLAGGLVSNTVTLVEFINIKRSEGLSIKDALAEAGMLRLRPILLTTMTTVLGLVPSIYSGIKFFGLFSFGERNYFVQPLALTYGYGLIFATVITLVLVPCFYHIAEDAKHLFAGFLGTFGLTMKKELY